MIVCALFIYLIAELVLFLTLQALKFFLIKTPEEPASDNKKIEAFKGILERITLTMGLFFCYPQVLIFFGALKLGTRLSEDNHTKEVNNFFLVGNLITVAASIAYTQVIKHYDLF